MTLRCSASNVAPSPSRFFLSIRVVFTIPLRRRLQWISTAEARARQVEYDTRSYYYLLSVREHTELDGEAVCFRTNIDPTRSGNVARWCAALRRATALLLSMPSQASGRAQCGRAGGASAEVVRPALPVFPFARL